MNAAGFPIVIVESAARSRGLERYAEWGTLAAIFLLFTNAVVVGVNFHGVPRSAALLVPMLFAPPLAIALLLRGERLQISSPLLWAGVYYLVQFAGCFVSRHPIEAMDGFVESLSEGLILYLLVSNALRTESMLRRAVWTLLAAGALMGALVGYQQVTHSFDNEFFGFAQTGAQLGGAEDGVQQVRLAGPIGEVNKFAQFMSMLIPLALFSLPSARTRTGKLLIVAAMGLVTLAAVLAFSRGIAVGLALTFAIMACMGAVRMKHVLISGLVFALAVAAVPEYSKRLMKLANLGGLVSGARGGPSPDSSTEGRLTEMIAAGLVFAEHPILGVGPGMARHHYRESAEIAGGRVRSGPREAHNLYLHIAAENGLLGLLAFGGMISATFINLQRARRRHRRSRPDLSLLATGLMMSIVVYLTTGLFLHISYVRYFWLFLGLTAAAGWVLGARSSVHVFRGYIAEARPEPAR
jgi:O-antigen ligase